MDLSMSNTTRYGTNLEQGSDLSKPQVFAVLVLIALSLLKLSFKRPRPNKQGPSLATAVCIFIAILAFTPLLLGILILFKMYRLFSHLYLKLRFGDSYVGLLEGPDSFWTTDESISKGVINILALVDFQGKDSEHVIAIARSKIHKRLLVDLQDKYKKMLYQRKYQNLGFTYWVRQKVIDIKAHVKLFKMELARESCTELEMKEAISSLCNLDLPNGNSTNWEVILLDKNVETTDGTLSAVLIRIHHSVGDGYALVDLFLNVLTDSEKNKDLSNEENNVKKIVHFENLVHSEHHQMIQDNTIHCKVSSDSQTPIPQELSKEQCNPDSNSDNLFEPVGTKGLLSEVSLEKSFKSKLFTQNMAKVNWNSLKLKTKIFLKIQKNQNKSDQKEHENKEEKAITYANKAENKNTKNTIVAFKKVNFAVNIGQKSDERGTLKEEGKQKMARTNSMTLELKMTKPKGTLFMNEMYFTPVTPMNPSMLLDCFSCKIELEQDKSLHHLQMLIIHTQQTLNSLCSLLFPVLYEMKKMINVLVNEISKILFLPTTMALKRVDNNRLHNTHPLSQSKTLNYVFDDNLFEMIRHIKTEHNIKFNEVILRAVSDSLEMYFKDNTESVNIIVPIPMSTKRSTMKNDFTVCMFDLCIRALDKTPCIHDKYLELQNNYETAVTYYLLKFMIDSIPHCLLKYVVRSQHSTLALSNMVGPDNRIFFSGHEIKRLTFFVPNKDTTGVGVTLLSYNKQLSLGIIMDESLAENGKKDANEILENIKNSIYYMYAECFV